MLQLDHPVARSVSVLWHLCMTPASSCLGPAASAPLSAAAAPAANVTLLFSYPVQLSVLQKSLQVVDCCESNAGSQQSIKVLPCEAPYVIVDPFASPALQAEQRQNTTCAVVQLSPGLPPQAGAIIRLPKGVRYNTVSGPTSNDTDVYVSCCWCSRRAAATRPHALLSATAPGCHFSSQLMQQLQASGAAAASLHN